MTNNAAGQFVKCLGIEEVVSGRRHCWRSLTVFGLMMEIHCIQLCSVVGEYVKQIDFVAVESPAIVNEWVEESTNGLIGSIVPEGRHLLPPNLLIAINSIYLKAQWHDPFDESSTKLDTFYNYPRHISCARLRHFVTLVMHYLPGYQIIDLPFAGGLK